MRFSIAKHLGIPRKRRGRRWLRRALRAAAHLEFFTIPPYLTAMWSVCDQTQEIIDLFRVIVRQEMAHMGMVCNLLTTLGWNPRINVPRFIPHYPSLLPGNVNPYCYVGLEPLSKCLVERVFLEIEKPDFTPIAGVTLVARPVVWYPTIGAFYDAIKDALQRISPTFTGLRQITYNVPSHNVVVTPISTMDEALFAIDRIKAEGEGTLATPGTPDTLAHYYKFSEMLHERRLVFANGSWSYTGAPMPFPASTEIHRMAKVPPGGYPGVKVVEDFAAAFSGMLDQLQMACDLLLKN